MDEFAIDADRLLCFDGRVVEQFWRGVSPGSSKWRIHRSQVGVEMEPNRKDDSYTVRIGDRYSGRVTADIRFDLPAARLAELQAFVAAFTG